MAKIKKDTSLRKSILQAAITGQLISNVDGETETGKQLLDRIIEERNKKLLAEWEGKLKENPKTKKPTQIVASEIDDDEIPFEIPEGWCWVRLGDVGDFLRGSGIKREETRLEGYPCIRYGEMYTKYKTVIKETVSFVEKEIFDKCQKIKTNDIVMSLTGENEYDIALAAVYLGEKVVAMGGDMTRFRPCLINSLFYVYAINSPYGIECKSQLATGNIIVHISNDKLSSILIPLPPLAVQNAIVAKLEEVLPLVDAYENAVLQKKELKTALPDTLKKAILQEAIQGKLTEDWRKTTNVTETGKQLLDRIIEERNAKLLAEWEEMLKTNPKAKKPTPIVASEIEEDEIPFEIPESWCWIKGKNIFAPMESIKPHGENFIYIDTDAVNNKLNIIDNPKNLLVKDAPSRASRKLHNGDVLFSMVRPYLKNIAFVDDRFADAIASTGFYVMTQIGIYDPKYLYYMVLSPYVIDGLHYFMKGDNSPSINTTDIDNFVYPLPPLEEQKKIVELVEELFPLCSKKE